MLAKQQTGKSLNSGPSHKMTTRIIDATNKEAIYKVTLCIKYKIN